MKLLLDTHTALWLVNHYEKLSPKAKDMLMDEVNTLYFSIASVWEVAIKASIGKLSEVTGGTRAFITQIKKMPIEMLPISPRHVETVEGLPFIHRDPFDRILIATAQVENMTIITADEYIIKYDVHSAW